MIGYVLLVSFAVIISVIVYQWIKTYVPRDSFNCPDETSLYIKDYFYNCSLDVLSITLSNNGKFDIGGYYIHATNSTNQSLATMDLSRFYSGHKIGNIVKFTPIADNGFKPNDEKTDFFNLTSQIYSVRITPVRWQVHENKKEIVSCGNSIIKESIYCS